MQVRFLGSLFVWRILTYAFASGGVESRSHLLEGPGDQGTGEARLCLAFSMQSRVLTAISDMSFHLTTVPTVSDLSPHFGPFVAMISPISLRHGQTGSQTPNRAV